MRRYFFVEETLGRSLDEIHHGVSKADDGEQVIALAELPHGTGAGEYKRAAADDTDDVATQNGDVEQPLSGSGIQLDVATVMAGSPPQRSPQGQTGAALLSATGNGVAGASDDDEEQLL